MTRTLIDIATDYLTSANIEVPADHQLAVRTARSRYNYRWTDGINQAPGPICEDNRAACPSMFGDGLCIGRSFSAIASGGVSAADGLLIVTYRNVDILGESSDKLRVNRASVIARVWLDELNLTGANLHWANLTGANLTGANLTGANLTGADLHWADLTRANLTRANLTRANLTRANLTRANLTRANLTGANLTGANLTRANLTRANLTRADLTRANLTGANLTGAVGVTP